jgi:protease II
MPEQEDPPIENKVEKRMQKGGVKELDLGSFHTPGERVLYDIKEDLYEGVILKEQDFRDKVKEHDWSQYEGKHVAITCSEDAIVPTWAYMLLAASIGPYAEKVIFGSLEELEAELFRERIQNELDPTEYEGARVIVKGCGDVYVPTSAFVDLTTALQPYAKTISYGEACSAVKVYQKKRKRT